MSKLRQDPSDEAELAKLLQKKRTIQIERDALELRIEELDRDMIEVQAKYGAIYNKRTSVLKLPTEVTCMIFSCAAGYPMEGDSENGSHLLLEVTVSHVCRQWRSICLAFPQLWASFSYDGPEASHVPLDRLDAYLERSSSQPLELWLDFREDNGSQFLGDSLALLEKTLSHINRWKRVTVLSDLYTPLRDFLSELDSVSAPNLEHFACCCGIPDDVHEPIVGLQASIFTIGAPNLTSVMLDCSSHKSLPPLSNVTTLRLEAVDGALTPFSSSAFIDILTLPCLINLSLYGEVFELPDNAATFGLITMNNLTHFRYSDTEGLALFLPYFRAPLLETLILQNDWFPEEFGASAELYVFPSLRSVSLIETTAATPQVALHFARMTESATEILFSQDELDESLFMILNFMSVSLPNINFWTKVKLLTCNSSFQSHIPYFVTFARAHSKNGFVLRIFDSLDECWKDEYDDEYEELAEVSTPQVALHFARMTESATEILFSQDELDESLFMILNFMSVSLPNINFWTKVKLLTCNSSFQSHIPYFVTFARAHSKNGFVLRIFDSLDECWKDEYDDEYEELAEVCTIEAMDTEANPLLEYSMWPPGEYNPAYLHDDDDPFDINPL
ncbi:hypothetical protein GALMADRAFT_135430 [Galerina marginata CBS 339.88]|uniref:Uncharacterized protein n=1 Tax=Galerina marginata (strain CBS 339.88) TaxID=685588 RepID=A0A067TSW3_GALM3|nr:hypothetical protein GALMADRAFT_135430 [Galerina marginata CBS 339.88]